MSENFPRVGAWILLILSGILLGSIAPAKTQVPPGDSSRPAQQPDLTAPTPAELEALKQRIIKNQHRDDLLLEQYERTEREHLKATGKGLSSKDTVTVIIPTGTGNAKVELERNGKPTAAAARAQQWRIAAQTLNVNSHPDNAAVRMEFERAERRRRERAETVDAMAKAFRFQYAGREMIDGRLLLKVNFEPEPGFHSSVRYASVWKHIHGTVWVDESNAQIVRVSGEVFDDVNIVAGLVVRVYRGSSMTLDQSEIAPGVWFPTRAKIDLTGRLFLLAATYHEQVENDTFQRVGGPAEALQKIFHGNIDDPPE